MTSPDTTRPELNPARAIAWNSVGRVLVQAVQFTTILFLARLLTPADFGLYAALSVLFFFGQVLAQGGLLQALTARHRPGQAERSTAFWCNLTVAILLFVGFGAAGPAVADLYDQPRLATLTWLVGANFLCATGVVHQALLERSLRFRQVATSELCGVVSGAAAGVYVALSGGGVLALVVLQLVSTMVTNVGYIVSARWWPSLVFRRAHVASLWLFVRGVLSANVLSYWARNADNLLIGRYVGASALGLYGRAYSLMMLPLVQVTYVLGRVLIPLLADIADDRERLAAAYLRTVRLLAFVTIPLSLGLAAVAADLIPVVLGSAWQEAVPLLILLALASVPQGAGASVGWLYQVTQRTDRYFVYTVVSSVCTVAAFVVGLPWGATGVAAAYLVVNWAFVPIGFGLAAGLVGLRLRDVLRPCLLPLGLSTVMVGAALTSMSPFLVGTPARLSAGILTGAVTYAALNYFLCTPLRTELEALRQGLRRPPAAATT